MSKAENLRVEKSLWEELCSLSDNVVGEIFNDELIVSPRPSLRHVAASSDLGVLIAGPFRFGNGGPGGWIILHEPELHFKDPPQRKEKENVVVPDLAGWKKERLPRLPKTAYSELPPDWVCEVLSPSTARYDRVSKLRIYAANKIPYYWIIDPIAKTLEILVFDGGSYKFEVAFSEDERVSAPPFEAIEFDLGALWYPMEPEESD